MSVPHQRAPPYAKACPVAELKDAVLRKQMLPGSHEYQHIDCLVQGAREMEEGDRQLMHLSGQD